MIGIRDRLLYIKWYIIFHYREYAQKESGGVPCSKKH